MRIHNKKKQTKKRILVAGTLATVVALAGLIILERAGITHITPLSPKTTQQAQTTSTLPSAQNNFSANNQTSTVGQSTKTSDPTPSTVNEGTATDNKGAVSVVPPESSWLKSSDGTSVIVYSPAKNQTLKSGDKISGSSTADKVNFRLIDSVNGVIAQGTLAVVGGKFSGTLTFTSSAHQGRVDVFTSNSEGVESNNVTVEVAL